MPEPVYIAAPFAGPDEDAVAKNVHRAVGLARLATESGYAPLVIHPAIHAGCYGNDDSPEDRARGLRIAVELVGLVATNPYGRLWVLARDDGSLSSGCAIELEHFVRVRTISSNAAPVQDHGAFQNNVEIRTWEEWQQWRPDK